jgi:hypothetical protein
MFGIAGVPPAAAGTAAFPDAAQAAPIHYSVRFNPMIFPAGVVR